MQVEKKTEIKRSDSENFEFDNKGKEKAEAPKRAEIIDDESSDEGIFDEAFRTPTLLQAHVLLCSLLAVFYSILRLR